MRHNTEIVPAAAQDYPAMIRIWEAAVRATHHFLPEADISRIKGQLDSTYFPAVTCFCAKEVATGTIKGFAGISGHKLEMLFIDPAFFGQGIGTLLLDLAIGEHGIDSVDVNEQNPKALGFYLKYGFKVVSRDEKDAQGDPFPILHLRLDGRPY